MLSPAFFSSFHFPLCSMAAFFFFFPFVFHLSQNVDIRLADRPCQMLGVLGGRSAPPTATVLNEQDRGPQGLLASPGRKTPLMLWFVTPAFMSEPCLGPLWFHPILVQTAGLVSASAFSKMWELPHVSSWRAGRGWAGLGGDATPHSKQKYSLFLQCELPSGVLGAPRCRSWYPSFLMSLFLAEAGRALGKRAEAGLFSS